MSNLVAIAALIVALVSYVHARRQARAVARLTEMYWQLKYEHGELKARVTPPADPPPAPATAFVPLGSVKRTST